MKSFLKYWLPLLIWLGVIFLGSTELLSAEYTSRFITPFLLWLRPGMSPQTIWRILVVVRKCAHVTEYAVLALLLWRALRSIPTLCAKMSISYAVFCLKKKSLADFPLPALHCVLLVRQVLLFHGMWFLQPEI